MPTIDELSAAAQEAGLPCSRHHSHLQAEMPTTIYKDADGEKQITVLIAPSPDGSAVVVAAPRVYELTGPHVDKTLRACAIVHATTGLVRFAYEEQQGHLAAIVELLVGDGPVSPALLNRCVTTLVWTIDQWDETLRRAQREGVIGLPAHDGDRALALELITRALLASPDEAGQALGSVLEKRLAD